MKKILSVILALLLVFSMAACNHFEQSASTDADSSVASSEQSEIIHRDPQKEGAIPLLYKITDKNGNYCYLFGSVHIGEDWMYPLPDYVLNSFNESEALALEIDVDKYSEDTQMSADALTAYVYRDGSVISDHISAELYEKAKEILLDTDYAPYMATLDHLMPSFWQQLVDEAYYAKLDIDFDKGVDRHLAKLAREADKPIYDIENPLEHMTFQAKYSAELQEFLLENSVELYHDDSADTLSELRELITAWGNGDYAKLDKLLNEGEFESEEEKLLFEEYNEAMMISRNRIMAVYIKKALNRGEKVFATVGAAHIVGSESVTTLLKKEGYTVERVK